MQGKVLFVIDHELRLQLQRLERVVRPAFAGRLVARAAAEFALAALQGVLKLRTQPKQIVRGRLVAVEARVHAT